MVMCSDIQYGRYRKVMFGKSRQKTRHSYTALTTHFVIESKDSSNLGFTSELTCTRETCK